MGSNYSWRALVDAPGTLPAGEAALWLRLLWMPAVGSMLIAVMLFPSGRPLSRRWGDGKFAAQHPNWTRGDELAPDAPHRASGGTPG